MKLSGTGIKLLKFFHMIFACMWVGGAASIMVLYFSKTAVDNADMIIGINTASRFIDIAIVIILGACGSFFTGLLYSLFTPWGFKKHRWILLKWILTITLIATGTAFLGPWEEQMLAMSKALGASLFTDELYKNITLYHFMGGSVQLLGLIFMIYLSVFRPFKR